MKKNLLGAIAGAALLIGAGLVATTTPAAAGKPEKVVSCKEAAEGSYRVCKELGWKESACRQIKARALSSCMKGK